VVLFIEIRRPLRFPYNLLNRLTIAAIAQSPFIKHAKENERAWEERCPQLAVGKRAPEGQR
jgi:ornithine lipid ester-linked acyl 2-hydroxylase